MLDHIATVKGGFSEVAGEDGSALRLRDGVEANNDVCT